MKFTASMITTSDTISHTRPAALALLLSTTNRKNGMLYSTKVPMLTMHEKVNSETGRSSAFFILRKNAIIVCYRFYESES